tara:strand:- start:868 stop:1056 length:189 start_codon:yes stop_codon:yes gene_type:complete
MPKKAKARRVPKLSANAHLATTPSVFNLPKSVEKDSKIQAKDVFEGYSAPKKTKGKKKRKVS